MKKLYCIILAVALLLSMFVLSACKDENGDDTEAPTDTNAGTEPATVPADTDPATEPADTEPADTEPADEANKFPYTGDVTPASVADFEWGAPAADAVYFAVDADHVIHDGKGTWSNTMTCIGTAAFDQNFESFYDCDEKCEYANTDDAAYGISGEWTAEQSGYVGAWIENGVYLNQIRWFPRTSNLERAQGCVFQASVDGVNWVDLYTIDYDPTGGDFEFVDIDEDYTSTIYYYVRYVSRDHETYTDLAYCNIAELEIWGVPANKPNRNIAADAEVEAPFCSSWESIPSLNDGLVCEFTFGSWEDFANLHYGSWGATTENTETITYTWSSEVTVDGIGVQMWNDQLDRATWLSGGGVQSPASYTVQYLNADGEYVDVENASGLAVDPDVVNVTTFDAVTTTSIQLTLYKLTDEELEGLGGTIDAGLGLGLYEFEVYKAQ